MAAPVTVLLDSLFAAAQDLRQLNRPFALVGGMAVSLRAEPRFTRDADLSVASDVEAELTVNALIVLGYSVEAAVEQLSTGRLATVRLRSRVADGIIVDLLFASSGIEPEIADAAEEFAVATAHMMPVAKRSTLSL